MYSQPQLIELLGAFERRRKDATPDQTVTLSSARMAQHFPKACRITNPGHMETYPELVRQHHTAFYKSHGL